MISDDRKWCGEQGCGLEKRSIPLAGRMLLRLDEESLSFYFVPETSLSIVTLSSLFHPRVHEAHSPCLEIRGLKLVLRGLKVEWLLRGRWTAI
jgi:hypothetical protein